MRTLQAAGIRCAAGECEIEARRLNEAYFKWVHAGTPFVTLKYAMTADGKIATRGGSSFWVSGLEARQRVAQLRSMVDAVLVGVGTVLADDPQLTARPGEVGLPVAGPVHQPLRVVLDSTARTPTIAKVLGGAARTIICTTERAAADRRAALEAKGAEVLVLDEREGRVDVGAALRALGDRGVISVLSEAGGTVAWSLLEAGAVDKVLAFIAPKLVGGREALSPIGGLGLDRMDCAVELATPEWTVLGRDVLLTAYVEPLSQVRQG